MSHLRFRYLRSSLVESVQSLLGLRDPLMPPRQLIDGVGGGDFKAVGQEFFRYFIEIGGLKPTGCVLDVGCGCGRMAVPLIHYLSEQGEYWGFDIVGSAIDWCQKKIAANDKRFHFQLADVYNKSYHPQGKHPASAYSFPYRDGFFDFAFLTSVFTHMLAPDMEHYLAELSRVLKSSGRCLVSFFLLNSESRELIRQGSSSISFKHEFPYGATSNLGSPEAAVAFDEIFIRTCFQGQHLDVVEPIRYGSWCGRTRFLSYQDIIVATRASTAA